MALLAAGFEVLAMMHRPKPERVAAVRLDDAVDGHAIAAVARRAAELLGIVNLQQFFIGMADENLFAAHGRLGQLHRLARAQMAGFAAVHQIDILDVDLTDRDGEIVHLLLQAGQRVGADIGNAVGKILVALRAQLGGGLQDLDALLQQLGLFSFPVLQRLVHLGEGHGDAFAWSHPAAAASPCGLPS